MVLFSLIRNFASVKTNIINMVKMNQWILAAVLSVCSSMTTLAQERVMDYPRAEWSVAGEILMHTPGDELFDGV